MKNTIIFIILITLTSCSQKWYAKQCNKRFPVIESTKEVIKYTKGKTDSFVQTITIDCDSAILALKVDTATKSKPYLQKIVKVPCPPSYYRVDTILDKKEVFRKDSAGNYLLQTELDHLRFKTQTQSEKITSQAKIIRKFYFWGIGIALLIAGLIFLKFYFKIKI